MIEDWSAEDDSEGVGILTSAAQSEFQALILRLKKEEEKARWKLLPWYKKCWFRIRKCLFLT